MQEISAHIFIETGYPGVTLGAINWPHGLILIDSPFRADDVRSWRSALLNLGGGVDRLMVNLDAHYDRTLGARAMDCMVIGHERLVRVFRNRPVTFKAQSAETGAEWELHNNLGSIRWSPPEITFSQKMLIHWNDAPVVIESHPGSASGSTWVILPGQKVMFVGDAVVPGQPPFLASANLPDWIQQLKLLFTPEYANYLVVGGRSGLLAQQEVRAQLAFLEKAHAQLERLAQQGGSPEDTQALASGLLKEFDIPGERAELYRLRMVWGLNQYFAHHYRSSIQEDDD